MNADTGRKTRLPKPDWPRRRIPSGAAYLDTRRLLRASGLHTVCQEARCPNMGECFSHRTATFLILGDRCTRHCRFCAMEKGGAEPPDPEEHARVAEAASRMALRLWWSHR